MLVQIPYNRQAAVAYANQWALGRNPKYKNFDGMGGDCTNFASQCLFAGCGVMNTTPDVGWYYYSLANRAPAWSGVEELYRFLTTNARNPAAVGATGPYATETQDPRRIQPGDLVQLGDSTGHFYHSPVITRIAGPEQIFVAAHTFDTKDRPLSSYTASQIRFLHIEGCRKWQS